jgi:hypothetical protein
MRLFNLSVIITLIVLAFAIFHVHNTAAAGTALGDLAASMPPGTWAQLTTNNINRTFTDPNGVSKVIIPYAEYIKWDPGGHRLYYLGGDHYESGTPVMRHVQYDEATNSWSILPQQSWFTAFSSHGYDHGAIDPVNRYFYFRPPGNLTMYRWNMDTRVWTAMPPNNVIQYDSCCVGIDYFPELHGVLWASDENVDNGGVTRLNDATRQWDRIGQAAAYPMGELHNFAQYNPVYKVMVFGGGQAGSAPRKIYKLDAGGAVNSLKDPPVDLGITNSIFTVDPVSGDYLVFTKTNQFYVYNVGTDTWTLRASGSSIPIWTTSYGNPVMGAIGGPIDTYGVNIFVTCDGPNNCRVNIYKHSTGSSPGSSPVPSDPNAPTSTDTPFDFSLSNGGSKTVTQGQSTSNTVTATLSSGTAQTVFFSASGLPSGATASFSPAPCVPTCTSTLNLSTSASTPAGSYPITVTGTSGSLSHSTSFTLTVSAPAASSSFTQKCAQSGVINCFSFDSASSLFYTWPTGTSCDAAFAGQINYGLGSDRRGPGNTAAVVQNGQCVYPQIDTTTSHSGAGSLKFTIPSNSSADSSGFFSEPYKRNSDGTFPYIGPGSPLGNVLYFQFYQKFDTNFVNSDYKCDGECTGWKQAIWFGNPPNGSSSSNLEVTMNNGWQRNVPQMYGQSGTDDYGIEDIINCTYANAARQGGSGSGYNSRPNYSAPLNPTCFHYPVDQWTEFTGRIEIRGAANAPASRVRLWINGQPAIDYGAARIDWSGGDGNGLGQFLLTSYHTRKDSTRVNPVGFTWYDDVIVSTQPIAMGRSSGSDTISPTVTTPPTVSIISPASGSTVSDAITVSATASDNVGVVGVQFLLDGGPLGAEVKTAPYRVPWNTATASNGTHTLAAVARVAAGKTATSPPVVVTVSNKAGAGVGNVNTVAFVQGAATTNDDNSRTIAQAFPKATARGSLIVAAISWGTEGNVSCSDSQRNTYAVATRQYDSANNQSLAICYAANIKGGSDTITVHFSGEAPPYRRLLIHEYQGIALTAPLDVVAKNTAAGSTDRDAITSGATTTAASGDLVFGAVMDDTGVNDSAAGIGFTQRQSVNAKDLVSEDLVQPLKGPVAATFTFSAEDRYLAQMVTFKHR